MAARLMLWSLVVALFAAPVMSLATGGDTQVFARRDDEVVEMVTISDDDDGDSNDGSNSGYTSGQDSNDRTGSGHSKVSWDGERSAGDRTRDRTRDGQGDHLRRDWSGGHTNDRSRNDSR